MHPPSPSESPPTSPRTFSSQTSPLGVAVASPPTSPIPLSEETLSEASSNVSSTSSPSSKRTKTSHELEDSEVTVMQWAQCNDLEENQCEIDVDQEPHDEQALNTPSPSQPSSSSKSYSDVDSKSDVTVSSDNLTVHLSEENGSACVSSGSEIESSESGSESEDNGGDSVFSSKGMTALYPQATAVTKEEAVLHIMELFVEGSWSKVSLEKTLKTVKFLLPERNTLPSSLHLLLKYVKSFGSPIVENKFFYCSDCKVLKNSEDRKCDHCGGGESAKFFEFSVPHQIKHMFENRNLADIIDSCESNTVPENGDITDIQCGTEYIKVKGSLQGKYDIILMWNTDGVSMAKSSGTELWPILCVLCNIPFHLRSSFMIIGGVWCDKQKPDGNLFLKPFVESLRNNYESGGVEWIHPERRKVYKSVIVAPILCADAPARAKVLNVKQFNHKYGCNTCDQKTVRIPLTALQVARGQKSRQRKFFYQENLAQLRTFERMSQQSVAANQTGRPEKGVIGNAFVCNLPFMDRAFCVGAEYMHNSCLGVTKYFLTLWFHVRGSWYIGNQIKEVDAQIKAMKVPDFVKRLPQGISSLSYWKASEFRFWLLFMSPIVLKERLPEKYFQHWILFVSALYLLLQDRISMTDLEKADVLLRMFVRGVGSLYSASHYTYNIHTLLHLPLLVRRWGPLWSTSAFMFENFNGVLGNLVHGTKHLGQELINNVKIAQGVEVLRRHEA